MSLATFFERIAGKQRQREQARINDYRGLVAAIAAGKEPNADMVDRVLRDTGKSIENLRMSVELHQKRAAWKSQLDALQKLYAEQQEVQREFAKANTVLEQAERDYDEAVGPLQFRTDQLKESIRAGELARNELIASCPDQDLRKQLDEVTRKMRALTSETMALQQTIQALRGHAESDRTRANNPCTEAEHSDFLERAKYRDAKADAAEKDLVVKEKAYAVLQKQEQALYEQMLEP